MLFATEIPGWRAAMKTLEREEGSGGYWKSSSHSAGKESEAQKCWLLSQGPLGLGLASPWLLHRGPFHPICPWNRWNALA